MRLGIHCFVVPCSELSPCDPKDPIEVLQEPLCVLHRRLAREVIVLLAQVEELADLGGPLGSQAPGDGLVGESGDLALSLLDDDHGEHGEPGVDDAAADGLALPLSLPALPVAGVVLVQEKADTALGEDTLLHWESLLVVAAGDPEDVALPLVSESGGVNLGAHALLVERTNLEIKTFAINFR